MCYIYLILYNNNIDRYVLYISYISNNNIVRCVLCIYHVCVCVCVCVRFSLDNKTKRGGGLGVRGGGSKTKTYFLVKKSDIRTIKEHQLIQSARSGVV